MDYIEITEEILDVNKISQMVTDPSCGAVSIFVGKLIFILIFLKPLSKYYKTYYTTFLECRHLSQYLVLTIKMIHVYSIYTQLIYTDA